MYRRQLILDKKPSRSFFLWGARQTGKSSLLKVSYPNAFFIDLLHTEKLIRYKKEPSLLRQELSSPHFKNKFVIIDEIQNVPELLNEVHWLIENKNIVFGLCGSSAKKLKKGHVNLLGGRADRFELFGFVSSELKADFSLIDILNNGYLPGIFSVKNPKRALKSYCDDYLKEEIAHEGFVQNFSIFNDFLEISALSDTEPVNFINIARECGISSVTAKNYFYILKDTLIGSFLPCYRKKPKRRTSAAPKFYFSDVGIVNYLTKRFDLQPGNPLFGKAFENWI
ncbi:MAG: AAA family ATPase, partial [Bdellovibrionales bacterium]|nr:AAA family ATPase [Bdellovibrionales bacterium]